MRVPLSWLRTFTPVALDVSDLAERLTMAGLEVEHVESIGAFNPSVVVGALRSRTPEGPLWKLSLDVGPDRAPVTVLSGAPGLAEMAPGTHLAVALPDAVLVTPERATFSLFTVAPARIRGHMSEAVVCSGFELGINHDHSGLYVLSASAAPGTAVRAHLTPDASWEADEVLEVAILPNFARCLSIVGMAREVAALTRTRGEFDVELAPVVIASDTLDATIEARDACKRFTSTHVKKLAVTPSPREVQRRLVLSGARPINNVVDLTNYVMFELGQPMHAYDAKRLPSERLGVRRARAGEKLHTLVQTAESPATELPEGVLLITSNDQPVAVAGVVGGTETSVADTTAELLLECASFEWPAVRRAQAALKVYTDASGRFSRGVDPTLTTIATRRFLHLLRETSPAAEVTGTGDTVVELPEVRAIDLGLDELEATMGVTYTIEEITASLARVGIETTLSADGKTVRAKVPPVRADVTRPCDLMEEIGRLVGYDRMPETMPQEAIPTTIVDPAIELRERARDALVRWGLQEVITYTLGSAENVAKLGMEPADTPQLRVMNPVNVHRTLLRRTLLPGLLETLQMNRTHTPTAHIFEVGVVMRPEESPAGSPLPAEKTRAAFALTGAIERSSVHGGADRTADFFDGASVVGELLAALNVRGAEIVADEAPPWQPGLTAKVVRGDRVYGRFGVVHPSVAEAFELGAARVVAGELDLDALIAEASKTFRVVMPSRFPTIELDISMFVERRVTAGDVVRAIHGAASPLLRGVTVLDVFEGSHIPAGSYSITARVELGSFERSLAMTEAQDERAKLVTALREKLGANVRE